MEHTKYFQSGSKEGEGRVLKYQKIHVQASILRCFWAWEPPRGRPGDHAGMGTPKITKKTLLGTLFLEHIYDRCWYFCGDCFLHVF